MATVRRIEAAGCRRMPWRNGGGTTTEIVSEPGAGDRFHFRLSVADVAASGPFSDFSGYDRHILLLHGDGFTLRVDGEAPRVLDRPLVPHAFDGGRAAGCDLHGGPVRDLNLMVDRVSARGSLRAVRLDAGDEAELPTAGVVLVHVAQGCVEVGGVRLQEGDTLRIDDGTAERLAATAVEVSALVVATVDPASP